MLRIRTLTSAPDGLDDRSAALSATLRSSGRAESPYDRWSYFPASPRQLLVCRTDGQASLFNAHGEVQTFGDPLAALRWLDTSLVSAAGEASDIVLDGQSVDAHHPELPPFTAGWIGYLSYDLGRYFEARVPANAADDWKLPLFVFAFYSESYALDHHSNRWFHCRRETPSIPAVIDSLPPEVLATLEPQTANPAASNLNDAHAFEVSVGRALEYIAAGDIFQVNLSHRTQIPLVESPEQIFLRAQKLVPAWYGASLNYGPFALVSNSPELFVQVMPQADGARTIVTRPIKGTRPRQAGMERILRDSVKDQAELNMIIDLERNDLGRICRIGSVRVSQPRTIEAHPTVYHGAATIQGTLRSEVTLSQILAAMFPGGSVTGAPKIRAMQIIDELEPVRRGPYCGAIGFVSVTGHVCLNLAIRTLVLTRNTACFHVGGGIVADSNPREEYEETTTKAQQLLAALGRS